MTTYLYGAGEFEEKYFQRRLWTMTSFTVIRESALINTDLPKLGTGVDFGNSHRGLINLSVDININAN